jgi:4-amino-4-deoxy-L-arabinose transferase-like glycosyltransferase
MRTSALQYLYLQKPISSVIIICAIALLPWTGDDFYTKGEPREASVAISMVESGNWILPRVYAGEFAYKPPMMHWLIAAFSMPQGHVSEFTSRLPSALAQIIMISFVLAFFGKRGRFQEAFIATLLLLTCFEIHRAGITARVDMLLTMFTVLGLMQLYRWENKLELKGLPVIIPLLFSCAVLTKGPVGIILPLFVYFVHLLLLRKYGFRKIIKSLFYIGVSSAFIPLIWYVAAYRQGGEEFLNLVIAENFGRFFHLSESAINYDLGHKEGVLYNFITVFAGFIPWTLLFVFSLFGLKYKRLSLHNLWQRFNNTDKIKRFCIVATVCILVFYTIPSSKRSVYMMPAYPFISLLLAQYIIYITENLHKATRIFAYVLTAIATPVVAIKLLAMSTAVDIAAIAAKFTSNQSALDAVQQISLSSVNIMSVIILLFMIISIGTVIYQLRKRINIKILYSTILLTFCLNLFIDGVVMSGIRANSSARPFAEQIRRDFPDSKDNIFVLNNLREYNNLYAMNYYSGNSLRDLDKYRPTKGYFLIAERDIEKALQRYGYKYNFERLSSSVLSQGDIRSRAVLFRINFIGK